MNLFVSNNYIYAEYTNMQSYALLIIRENSAIAKCWCHINRSSCVYHAHQ